MAVRNISVLYPLIALLLTFGSCLGSAVRNVQHALSIDDSNWKVTKETDGEIDWLTKDKEGVTLMLHGGPSAIRNPNDQKALQAVFRDEAKRLGGGLVEVKSFESNGVKGAFVTMKFRMSAFSSKSDGWAYQINAIIPMKEGDCVLQVAGAETGTTGVREATVTIIDMRQRKIEDLKSEAIDFRRDPYDPKYNLDAL